MEGCAEEAVAGDRLPFLLAQRGTQSRSNFYTKGGARWTRAVNGKPAALC